MKINKIYYLGVVLLLAGCSREAAISSDSLSGGSKTPLTIEARLCEAPQTRATGKTFAENDILLSYIRHINNTDAGVGSYASVQAHNAPLLVAFKKGSTTMTTVDDNTNQAADLTSVNPSATETAVPLYWDDFSDSRSTATDLRTANHGLQSYYGYCYNGGTPSTALVAETGVLGWTIGNQTTAEDVRHSDLLWSPAQEAVTYAHTDARAGAHGTITIPYTHAMSEITVTLTAGTGFSGNPLTSTVLTLNEMNTVATLTAPTSTVTSTTLASVTMYGESYSSGLTRDFMAIVAPRTKLKVDNLLLGIVNVDDNNYELKITSDMIGADKWATGHVDTDKGTENGKAYILTKPGYNYHLDITVNKTEVSVRATIRDWVTVSARGTGDVQYDNDYTDLVMDDSEVSGTNVPVSALNVSNSWVTNGSAFTLFWMSQLQMMPRP